MKHAPNPLIADLVADLQPVKPLSLMRGVAMVTLASLAMVIVLLGVEGHSGALLVEHFHALAFVTAGLFLVTGVASVLAVLGMARPQVGNRPSGARWSVVALSILPLGALAATLLEGTWGHVIGDPYGTHCAIAAGLAGLFVGSALVLYLRKGAPVSLRAVGIYTGVAAGSLGSAAYGLSCSMASLEHLGFWHVAPVVISAIAGRYIVPMLVRW